MRMRWRAGRGAHVVLVGEKACDFKPYGCPPAAQSMPRSMRAPLSLPSRPQRPPRLMAICGAKRAPAPRGAAQKVGGGLAGASAAIAAVSTAGRAQGVAGRQRSAPHVCAATATLPAPLPPLRAGQRRCHRRDGHRRDGRRGGVLSPCGLHVPARRTWNGRRTGQGRQRGLPGDLAHWRFSGFHKSSRVRSVLRERWRAVREAGWGEASRNPPKPARPSSRAPLPLPSPPNGP
jgi:hypothetical protein